MRTNRLSTTVRSSFLFLTFALVLGSGFLAGPANAVDLVASSAQEAKPIEVGTAAPDAGLRDLAGNDVTLYEIVAISPDLPHELNKMTAADHLNYRLFSDPQAEAMKKFGVAYQVDNTTLTKMKQKFDVDLERASGQTHHILPVPSVFILDRGGKME
jgi:AhpC/TSA family